MKACCRCKVEKPNEDFAKNQRRCRECDNEAHREARERRKARMAEDPEYAERVRSWGRESKRRARDVKYGLAPGTVDRMTDEQGGRCAICRRTPEEVGVGGRNGQVLYVDHDHRCCGPDEHGRSRSCGECVRGLLCKQCNSALGLLAEDPDRIKAMLVYLEEHS